MYLTYILYSVYCTLYMRAEMLKMYKEFEKKCILLYNLIQTTMLGIFLWYRLYIFLWYRLYIFYDIGYIFFYDIG